LDTVKDQANLFVLYPLDAMFVS